MGNSPENTPYGADVLVALSGGLDSAAAVLFLREAGYRPRAVFFDLLDSETARQQASATAERLDVGLTVIPFADRCRAEILTSFLADHTAGRTPSPCARCNPRIKWQLLAETADRMGIRHLATGHYVRSVEHHGHHYFSRGADPAKDQSYYLWDLPEGIVRRALLPLGNLTKTEVRQRLQDKYRFTELAARRESMSLCFLEGMRYVDFLKHHLPPGVLQAGEVVDEAGHVIGRHEGYPLYTAGQKRGFTLFDPQAAALAVVAVDPARNRIIVGPDTALYSRRMILRSWHAVDTSEFFGSADRLQIVVRGIGRNPRGGCRLTPTQEGLLEVTLTEDAAWALIPGQPVVFYLEDRVVGGGMLERIPRD